MAGYGRLFPARPSTAWPLMLDFAKLRTPAEDGQILIEPPPAQWPRLLAENIRRRRAWDFTLAGEPVASVVAEARAGLLNGPVVAAGHQPAFVHPGVWAKHVVVHHATESLGVEGLDLVVDNDAPAGADLSVPVVSEAGWVSTREVAFSQAPAGSAYEGRPALPAAALTGIENQLRAALADRFDASELPNYLRHLNARPEPRDWVVQHLAGREAIDEPLRANIAEARVSDAFGGLFLADLLLNAERFAFSYNAVLAKYRQEHDVRSPDRPLPNLGRDGERHETPLWIYQPLQRRRRLWVERQGEGVCIFVDQNCVGSLLARDLAREPVRSLSQLHPWLIRPRALTLTLWARLLACDLFVHGIGGAKYDRITDDIIRRHYRCEPPAYGCVTATLRLPLPVPETTEETLRNTGYHLRDWRFNPQRYLRDAPASLLAERTGLIQQSEQLRRSRAARTDRRQVRQQIHDLNRRLVAIDPGREARLLDRLTRERHELDSRRVATSREFFYCLQPRDRLEMLAGRLCDGW